MVLAADVLIPPVERGMLQLLGPSPHESREVYELPFVGGLMPHLLVRFDHFDSQLLKR